MKVLLTGGAGYIGSVTASALERSGHVPVIVDSLASGPAAFVQDRIFYRGDFADRALVQQILAEHPDIECTIHMAALTVVAESMEHPELYHRVNVVGTGVLAEELIAAGRPRLVYSSSAAVYGQTPAGEVFEDRPLNPNSPYARTKIDAERLLSDQALAGGLRVIALRYFNPVGADPDLRSGPYQAEPTVVLGKLIAAATGRGPTFTITGTDLPTRDGTGVRDFVHVWDVARAHVAAVEGLDSVLTRTGAGFEVMNVGTGRGTTIRELVSAVERVLGTTVPVLEGPSRPGDIVGGYANVDRIAELLGWRSRHTLDEAIASALAWEECRHQFLGD